MSERPRTVIAKQIECFEGSCDDETLVDHFKEALRFRNGKCGQRAVRVTVEYDPAGWIR